MDSPCRIEMLGGLKVMPATRPLEEGNAITRFATRKTAALLAYLAYHLKQPARPREVLADMFWPDADMEAGRASLRAALASLRRQLEPPGVPPGSVLLADRFAVRLNPLAVVTDVAEFEAALKAAAPASQTDANARIDRLARAVALYAGDLLPGFYESWTIGEREQLRSRYLTGLRKMFALAEQIGDPVRALESAQRWAASDPLNKEAQQALIRAQAASGRAEAAVRLAPPLTSLPSVVPQGLSAQSPVPPVRAPHLPLALTRFFGREADTAHLQNLLSCASGNERARLVTLTGPGGAGKTRLAVETARRLSALPGLFVVFVPLADVTDPALLLSEIADSLRPVGGASPSDSDEDRWEQITSALSAHTASLLVLDNFEQLTTQASAYTVQSLLNRVPGLACLITSRHCLNVEGEREFPLLPLSTPNNAQRPERLMEFAAVQLFVDRAQAARPDFQLTPGNAPAVAALCRRLEGMPLALELAASWAQTLSPAQMLARLEHSLQLLVSRHQTRVPRHQSLRAALDGSYQLLSPSAQDFFTRLSVFRGGWTVEAAEAICETPDALEELTLLRERSLIVAEAEIATTAHAETMRFRMAEIAREYAWEQLSANAQTLMAHRHAHYFAALADALEPELRGANQAQGLARLEREHDNLRAVLARWESAPIPALRLAGALGRFWLIRGHWSEGREWLRKIITGVQSSDAMQRARALASAGALSWALDAYEEATLFGEQSLRLCQLHRDDWGTAYAQTLLGIVAARQGHAQRATYLLEESLAGFRTLQERWGMAYALDNLAYVAREAGEYERAAALNQESLTLRTAQGDRQGIAISFSNLGDIALLQDDWQEATVLHGDSLERFRALGDKVGTAYALNKMGVAALRQGETTRADALCRDSLALFWELRDKRRLAECLRDTAKIRAACGRHETAARLLGAANALHDAIGASASSSERADRERCAADIQAALGTRAFTRARTQGQAMTLEEAVADALQICLP